MRRIFRLVVCMTAIAGSVAVLNAQAVQYVYDELGRLVAVVAPNGESAVYTYDAVGNLLSIARHPASAVTLVEFTPNGGPIGAGVTLYGTGFSPTPSQNTVTFNGTAATVTASTATSITTSVPANATSGAIAVTTPTGSATSASSFTVVTASATPTITSFTPSVGTAGVQVTVSGTNFETVLANNRLKVGVARSAVSAASGTSLTATVPPLTGSGKIALTTPAGAATSASDFFVPPLPYTAGDVVFTDRLTFSEAKNVTVSTGGKIGLVVFDGTLNQRVSLKVVPGPTGEILLYKPDGTFFASSVIAIGTFLIEPPLLPAAGTYTVNVDLWLGSTGTETITCRTRNRRVLHANGLTRLAKLSYRRITQLGCA